MMKEVAPVPLIWRPVGESGISDDLDEHNSAVVEEIARLIKSGERQVVRRALKRWPPAHLLALFVYLPLKRARVLIDWLDQPQTKVVAELNPAFRDALLEDVTVQRLAEVLGGFEPEDAVDAPIILALTAGLALLAVVTVAVAVGATIPIVLDRIGIDPAMATGVFITTGNDILSVMIFFALVSLFYL